MDSIYIEVIPFLVTTLISIFTIFYSTKPKVLFWYSERIIREINKSNIGFFNIDIINPSILRTAEDIIITIDGKIDKPSIKPFIHLEPLPGADNEKTTYKIQNLGKRESVTISVISICPKPNWTFTTNIRSKAGKAKYLEKKYHNCSSFIYFAFYVILVITVFFMSKFILGSLIK